MTFTSSATFAIYTDIQKAPCMNTRMSSIEGLKIKQFIPKPQSTTAITPAKRSRTRIPDEQRKRARQACESCRQRKEKCCGGIPCQKCSRDNTICTLASSRKSSSPEPQQRPRLSKAERGAYLEKVLKSVLGTSTLHDNDLISMAEALSKPTDTSKHETTLLERNKNNTDCGAESSLLTFSKQLQQKLGGAESSEVTRNGSITPPFLEQGTIEADSVRLALSILPSRHVAEALIAVFFRYTQCNNFYVTGEWIQETLDACYSATLQLNDNDLAGVTTFSMIIALGTQFANMVPSGQFLTQEDQGCTLAEVGQKLYDCSTRNLSALIKQPTFESMRACLLMAVYLFPIDLPGLAYTYLGLAIHMAIRIGLHKRARGRSSKLNREVQTRVWWTLYTFYQRARIFHGHPRTLSHSDIEVDRPRPMQMLEPSNGVSNFRNQVALIDITIILEDVAAEIALLRKARKTVHIATLLFLRRKLTRLLKELPSLDKQVESGVDLHSLRLDIHIYLHYWHTRLFLGRPFLLSHPSKMTEDRNEATMESPANDLSARTLAQDSVDAAFSIIQLCQTIHDRIGLAQASYATEFTSCRAAMLVLIASSITDKSSTLSTTLAQGLTLIQQMSVGQGQASSETRVIEALQLAIARLHGEPSLVTTTDVSTTPAIETLEDSNFRQWERLWEYTSNPFEYTTSLDTLAGEAPVSLGEDLSQPATSLLGEDLSFDSNFYGTEDMWTALFHSQLDEFNLIPEMDSLSAQITE